MGWHPNTQRGQRVFSWNPRSPRYFYTRTAPTKRQLAVYRRANRQCPHSLSFQIGGGQCGKCGKWTFPWGKPHPDRRTK